MYEHPESARLRAFWLLLTARARLCCGETVRAQLRCCTAAVVRAPWKHTAACFLATITSRTAVLRRDYARTPVLLHCHCCMSTLRAQAARPLATIDGSRTCAAARPRAHGCAAAKLLVHGCAAARLALGCFPACRTVAWTSWGRSVRARGVQRRRHNLRPLCLPSAGLLPLPRIGRVCCSGSFLASWPCFRGQYADPEVRLSWPGADTLFRLRALKTNCITETLRVCAPESSRLRGYYAPPLRVA